MRRRGWLLVVSTLLVAGLAVGFASLRGKTYTTNLVLVVSLLNQGHPLADEADKLATTYAEVITNDGAVLSRVGNAVGRSSTEVKENLEVTTAENTSIIHAQYTGTSRSEALAATRALLNALTGHRPATGNISPRTIRAVQIPTEATAQGGATTSALAIGVILGLALGGILLLAWERADPKLDSMGQFTAEAGVPTTDMATLDRESALTLLARWRELAGSPIQLAIRLIPADTRSEAAARGLSDSLNGALEEGALHDSRHNPREARAGEPLCVISNSHSLVAQGTTIEDRGFVVLIARPGISMSIVRESVADLGDLGHPPHWGVFASRKSASRRAARKARRAVSKLASAQAETPEPQDSLA